LLEVKGKNYGNVNGKFPKSKKKVTKMQKEIYLKVKGKSP